MLTKCQETLYFVTDIVVMLRSVPPGNDEVTLLAQFHFALHVYLNHLHPFTKDPPKKAYNKMAFLPAEDKNYPW